MEAFILHVCANVVITVSNHMIVVGYDRKLCVTLAPNLLVNFSYKLLLVKYKKENKG